LGQVVYYVCPWFWGLRRQVALCQEYVADAAVVAGGGSAPDYAEFLVRLTQAPALPAGATGVSGNASDLYRRVNMLLRPASPVENRGRPRGSLLAAAGLLSLAVRGAGVGLQAAPLPPAPEQKDEPKKDEPKKDEPKKDEPKKNEPKKADPKDDLFPQLP